MKFIDEARINASAGDGGDGAVHFRREAHVPKGGPDGGDGGRGGAVVAVANRNLATLVDFRHRVLYRAGDGRPGGRSNCAGRSGADLIIELPVGTLIHDTVTGELVADLIEPEQRVVLCVGGRGGLGNVHFKSSRRQTPDKATPGRPGQERELLLELKLVADVGLVGQPNAGKSTLIRGVSSSKARVGAYPFTTLSPNLGAVQLEDREFVVADIPGLIQGASEGKGLGIRFLKHVQRAGLLVHLVSGEHQDDVARALEEIQSELAAFDPDLPGRVAAIALTKIDLYGGAQADEVLLMTEELKPAGVPVFPLSAVTGEGVKPLVNFLAQRLQELAAEAPVVPDDDDDW